VARSAVQDAAYSRRRTCFQEDIMAIGLGTLVLIIILIIIFL
jgi:hypothetical protein